MPASGEPSAPAPAVDPAAGPARFAPWGYDLSALDPRVKPGQNFFDYANGGWLQTATIAPDRSNAGNFVALADLSETRVHAILEGAAAPPAGASPGDAASADAAGKAGAGRIGVFYHAFMDEAQVEALDAEPLGPELAAIRAAADPAAIATLMGRGQRGFLSGVFGLQISADQKDAHRYSVYLGQGEGGLPDRDEYLKPDFAPQREKYRAYVAATLAMIGWADAEHAADAILALETGIAGAGWTRTERRDPIRTYNPTDVSALAAYAPGFDWAAFLAAADLGGLQKLVLVENTAVRDTAAIVGRAGLDTLRAWSAFHLAAAAAPDLSQRFAAAHFDFYGRTLNGQPDERARWKRAVAATNRALGEAVGERYVAQYFPPSSKAAMVRLVDDLKLALRHRLETVTWMDEPTRAEALRKLAALDVQVGYPKAWRDYSALEIRPGDLYGNVERATDFEWQRQVRRLDQPVDRDEWGMSPQTVNAYNEPSFNEVVFPAAILQPPFFNPDADEAVNYGAIGGVIGHEMTHSFDDQGRHYDEAGNLRDWWSAGSAERFGVLAAQLGAQFDAMQPFPGLHVNGALTMGENIADLGGLNLGLDAYHDRLAGAAAPVVGGMSGDQRVFLGWAQAFRAKVRDSAAKQRLVVDPHSPPEARVDGPMANIDAWYQAFGVAPGEAMFLAPEKRVRIW
jgi:putative endopeptidase